MRDTMNHHNFAKGLETHQHRGSSSSENIPYKTILFCGIIRKIELRLDNFALSFFLPVLPVVIVEDGICGVPPALVVVFADDSVLRGGV